MKRSKRNRKEHQGINFEAPEKNVIELRHLARDIARRNGIDEDEIEKIITALEDIMLRDLLQYGAADFLGIGKLVLCYTPDLDVKFIPYPENAEEPKPQWPSREYLA